jgi:hypothetical protein
MHFHFLKLIYLANYRTFCNCTYWRNSVAPHSTRLSPAYTRYMQWPNSDRNYNKKRLSSHYTKSEGLCLSRQHDMEVHGGHGGKLSYILNLTRDKELILTWLHYSDPAKYFWATRGPGFDSWSYHIFCVAMGLERGPLGFVTISEELLETKVAAPV